ncbi:MAG TPA: hypothetical protein VIH24_05765 [Candidatus Limnocylindria bacterium]|jgi:hypothetical protein
MSEPQYFIDLEGDQRAIVDGEDAAWLRDKLRGEPGSTRLRVRSDDDADTEGHGATARIGVIVETDDTEGHAISMRFPSVEEADAFRKRLLVTGVLAGSVALGAVGGIGFANLASTDAPTAAAAGSAAGSAWTQDERPLAAAAAGSATGTAAGSAWTQDERASDVEETRSEPARNITPQPE